MIKPEKKQILSALLLLAFCAAVSMAGYYAGNGGSTADTEKGGISQDIADTSGLPKPAAADAAAGMDLSSDESMGEPGGAKADFGQLKAQNPDIYAWITVPGTGIDYPILQKGDAKDPYDNYYLDHRADLSEGLPGAIYSQPVNGRDFTDAVTVLYGHNMKNGEMFGSLHLFADKEFFDQNSRIIIYTPEKELTYEIFAAVDFSDALLPYEYDFTKNAEIQRHLVNVRECEGNFREETAISEGAKILVLSTCYSSKEERRFLVEAVLMGEEDVGE